MRIGDVLHFSVIPLVLKDDRGRTCLPRMLHASARSCGYGMDSPRRRRICRKPAWLLFRLQENRPLAVGRWFADYEERNNSPESGEQRFRLCGLSSIEEARRECE